MKVIAIASHAAIAASLLTGASGHATAQEVKTVQDADGAGESATDIIVTGTRASGVTAAESTAPIKLVGADAISHVGQPNLNQVLTQLVPSFTAQSTGGDTANLTLTAALRGLSPNQTLVLVNGKRRHGTSNLQVALGAFQGGAAPDLDFIAPISIDHIEVLEDGAAAQYGSDAIAGVINIILKKRQGGELSATGGQYYAGDGETLATSLNYGLTGSRGFLNVTAFFRTHDFSNRAKYDIRIFDPAIGPLPTVNGSTLLAVAVRDIPGYPNINRIVGDAQSRFGVVSYNAGVDLAGETQLYSFGTLGFRRAKSFQNARLPDRVVGSDAVDPNTGRFLPGDYDDAVSSGDTRFIPRPLGYSPQEELREIDYQFTAGAKGALGGWRWDLSTGYGADRTEIYTRQSINPSLYIDFHDDQADFYDGFFQATEWVSNLDLSHDLGSLGSAAAGVEYRENGYSIGAGEPSSYYGVGASAFPGFNPLAAGRNGRHSYAVYGDLALTPADRLKFDAALRYESYSDFGDTLNWRLSGRYDFTPQVAIRGTASTGFRAPTLAEQYYTAVNASPTDATAQLAANSAAAKVLGIQNLKPEKSTSFSAGLVLRPNARLTVTVDAFHIAVRDRIVGSGQIAADPADPNDPVTAAIRTAGVNLEPGLPSFVSAFVNGPNTRTRGIDIVASYDADLGTGGRAVLTLSGAYNRNVIIRDAPIPPIIAATGQQLLDPQAIAYLTTTQPKVKVIGGVNWSLGDVSVVARGTVYGKSVARLFNDSTQYVYSKVGTAFISDLEVSYKATGRVTFAIGANNLFDRRPPRLRFDSDGILSSNRLTGGAPFSFGPYNFNGGYWYGRATVRL